MDSHSYDCNFFWNMFVCCAGARKDQSFETGSSQSSIKDQGEGRRKLCSLRIDEDIYDKRDLLTLIDGIVEEVLRRMKSQRIGKQFEEYPQEIKDNKKYMTIVWSKDKMGTNMQKIE